jgi:hypothetical protein
MGRFLRRWRSFRCLVSFEAYTVLLLQEVAFAFVFLYHSPTNHSRLRNFGSGVQ